MKRIVLAGLLAFSLAACGGGEEGLESYEGESVATVVQRIEASSDYDTAVLCEGIATLGYSTVRQIFVDTEPQIGTDEFEGAVFSELSGAC